MRNAAKPARSTLMTEGPIARQLIAFALPLMLGNLFQQMYNTADSLIVGNFLGSDALAAVSSSSNLIQLMIGFFNGVAGGAGVVIARCYGARDIPRLKKALHTMMAFGLAAGCLLTAVGVTLTPVLLRLMGTPETVLPQSVSYFRTYFLPVAARPLPRAHSILIERNDPSCRFRACGSRECPCASRPRRLPACRR